MPRAALCTAKGSIDQFCVQVIAGGFTAASAARLKYGAVDRTALQPFKLMNNAVIPTCHAARTESKIVTPEPARIGSVRGQAK